MWQTFISLVLLAMLTVPSVNTETTSEEATLNITIRCPETDDGEHCLYVKTATEYTLELSCHVTNTYKVSSIHWIHHNGSDINHLASERMHYDATNTTATLTITSVQMEDSGNYSCVTSLPVFQAVVEIEAYVMPDYFIAGMILLGINLGLCVLFVACLVRSMIKQRKSMKERVDYNKFEPLSSEKEVL
jgi:hypothetical protein